VFDPLSAAVVIGVIAIIHRATRVTREHGQARRRSLELAETEHRERQRYADARLELHRQVSSAAHETHRITTDPS
jgi:hypothetical protein